MGKQKCVVFGVNDFAVMVQDYMTRFSDIEVVAYTLNKEYITEEKIGDLPVVPFEDIVELYPPEKYSMIVTLGYRRMNDMRKKIFTEAKALGYRMENFIHPTVYRDTEDIGEGNIIFENATINSGAKIGNGNIIWNGCHVSHECTLGDFNFMAGASVLAGKVTLKNNCFMGLHCTVSGGVTCADYTLVGANGFLAHDSKPYGVYLPAKTVCLENKKSIDMI